MADWGLGEAGVGRVEPMPWGTTSLLQLLRHPYTLPVPRPRVHLTRGRSTASGNEDSRLDPAYASNLDDVVAVSGARLWFHGHLHTRADYTIGGTRVVCNARGYPDETGHGFEAGLTVRG